MQIQRVLLCVPFVCLPCQAPLLAQAAASGAQAAAEVAIGGPATCDPAAAMAWHMLRLRDEYGRIDPLGVDRARADRDALVDYCSSIDDGGIGRFSWVERGPFNAGGRTRGLWVDPLNGNELWAGSVGGGIWHSTNAGASWSHADDYLGNLAVTCITAQPSDRNVLYAATGEGFYNSDGIRGRGVWKSTNHGASWQQLPGTASWSYVNRIAVSPGNPNVILAALQPIGIMLSNNGGASWFTVWFADAATQILFDPNNPLKAVAAAVHPTYLNRALYSNDGGFTWTIAATGLAAVAGLDNRIELAYARSVPNMVYAAVNGQCWRSSDGGVNWSLRGGTGLQGSWWYDNAIWVDPTNANNVVIGGTHLYRSTNGGTSFTPISNGSIQTAQPHPGVHAIVADSGYNGTTNKKVYVATDGGVWSTADVTTASTTAGWTRRDQGYRTSQFYSGVGSAVAGRLHGGTQDNGELTVTLGNTNAALTHASSSGMTAIDHTNTNYVYGEGPYLTLVRSTNGGGSAASISAGLTDAGAATTANWVAPFLLDPSNPRRLYAGGARLWRTDDARAATVTWTAVKPNVGSNISAIAVRSANEVWVGHNDGRIYKTVTANQASPTWIAVDDNSGVNPLPNRMVTGFLLYDFGMAYATFGGYTPYNIRYTLDNGVTWYPATGGGVNGPPSGPGVFPQVPVLSICAGVGGQIYVGTELGLFASEYGGSLWSATNDGPADVRVDQVSMISANTLLAATHGRGLWTIDIRQATAVPFGTGCAGANGVPNLFSSGTPRIGLAMPVTCNRLRANTLAFAVLGFSDTSWNGNSLPLSLTGLGMTGCSALCSPDLTLTGSADGNGVFRTSIPLPPNQNTLGGRFWMQAMALDPGVNPAGAVVSNGLAMTIGN